MTITVTKLWTIDSAYPEVLQALALARKALGPSFSVSSSELEDRFRAPPPVITGQVLARKRLKLACELNVPAAQLSVFRQAGRTQVSIAAG